MMNGLRETKQMILCRCIAKTECSQNGLHFQLLGSENMTMMAESVLSAY